MKKFGENGVDYLLLQLSSGETAEIYDIAVMSKRGIGIGTKLLTQAIAFLSKAEIKRVFAVSRETNLMAQKFYRKNGFKGTLIENFYPDGNAVIYIREV